MGDLEQADLSGAELDWGILNKTNLKGANLYGASLFATAFSDVDLSGCKNLENIRHHGRSSVDTQTLERSGQLPLVFPRGVGPPENLIDCLPSLRPRHPPLG